MEYPTSEAARSKNKYHKSEKQIAVEYFQSKKSVCFSIIRKSKTLLCDCRKGSNKVDRQ